MRSGSFGFHHILLVEKNEKRITFLTGGISRRQHPAWAVIGQLCLRPHGTGETAGVFRRISQPVSKKLRVNMENRDVGQDLDVRPQVSSTLKRRPAGEGGRGSSEGAATRWWAVAG